jgi:hypothetical protein
MGLILSQGRAERDGIFIFSAGRAPQAHFFRACGAEGKEK